MAREEFLAAVASGEVQRHIDDGYTTDDIRYRYGTSYQAVRDQVVKGTIRFKHNGKHSRKDVDPTELWSDAKRLALCGRWI